MGKLYLLNSPIITSFGSYEYRPITCEEAREIVNNAGEFISAIGHSSTSMLLSKILGVEVKTNRISIKMEENDRAIIIRVLERLEEGRILCEEEVEALWKEGKIELGLLKKVK